ncbi:MAG: phosphoribosylanthranilate isomerase, partial [Mariprofundaceae bacterium]
RVIKAIAVESEAYLKRARQYPCAVLLDAKAPAGVHGGAGQSFDWSLARDFRHDYPLILAGGLNAENVGQALAARDWFAVDVASGVESSPGVKDAAKLRAFVRAVAAADAARIAARQSGQEEQA